MPSPRSSLKRLDRPAARPESSRRRGRLIAIWLAIGSTVLAAPVAATACGFDPATVVNAVSGVSSRPAHGTGKALPSEAANASSPSTSTRAAHGHRKTAAVHWRSKRTAVKVAIAKSAATEAVATSAPTPVASSSRPLAPSGSSLPDGEAVRRAQELVAGGSPNETAAPTRSDGADGAAARTSSADTPAEDGSTVDASAPSSAPAGQSAAASDSAVEAADSAASAPAASVATGSPAESASSRGGDPSRTGTDDGGAAVVEQPAPAAASADTEADTEALPSAAPAPSASASASASTTAPTTGASTGRFGAPLYVDARVENVAAGTPLSSLSGEDRQAVETIASQPTAHWLVTADGVTADVAKVVSDAARQGAIATFVAYNIPHRDCGYFSGNGPQTSEQYRQWVRSVVAGLGGHRAIMIVEPDALPLASSCLSGADLAERIGLIRYAVQEFSAQGSYTYLDAGNSAWLSVSQAASLLQQAGIDRATGFSLNVSQYRTDAESIQYGNQLSAAVGGKHFIVDSSRNGVAPTNTDWCNPPGKGLGHRPTTSTGVPLLDARLWVKTPGQSDGQCLGGPAAGQWYASYATMLVRNAAR